AYGEARSGRLISRVVGGGLALAIAGGAYIVGFAQGNDFAADFQDRYSDSTPQPPRASKPKPPKGDQPSETASQKSQQGINSSVSPVLARSVTLQIGQVCSLEGIDEPVMLTEGTGALYSLDDGS